jgi:hypothetical protein
MSFDESHYVPVLKMKAAEKEALALLSQEVRDRITPLFEIVERDTEEKATPSEHIDTAFKKFQPAIEHLHAYFLDCQEIAGDGAENVEDVFRRANDLGTAFVPVTGMTRTVDIQPALSNRTSGLALRLTREEFESGAVQKELLSFVKTIGVPREVIDLIIDLGAVNDMVLPGVQAAAAQCLADVPDPTTWRTLTLSAAAIPPGMGGLESRSHDLIDRLDWIAWRDAVRSDTSLPRVPTFSDGVIQHPSGVENIDWSMMNPPASIRYTTGDQWLRIKGEGIRTKLPSEQYPGMATSLVYGTQLSHHFLGKGHCDGCFGMWCAADGADGYGSLGVWRRLGTVHHITRVIEQLDELALP